MENEPTKDELDIESAKEKKTMKDSFILMTSYTFDESEPTNFKKRYMTKEESF